MLNTIKNEALALWIDECVRLCEPRDVVLIDGSDGQAENLKKQACESGELIRLNEEKLPNCFLHRSDVNDVARVENRTYICTQKKSDAGNINNWIEPEECKSKLTRLYRGSMKGRTMYVIPYSMGKVGSPFAKYGIELTDSVYVILNMLIMTRAGKSALDAIEDGADFIKGLHSTASLDKENRYIVHFPEENTIWSINSAYGGNVLLGKKCFALRIASYLGRKEGWLAEHMLILGIEREGKETKYICAAFPSACGKTNLAMLVPPDIYKKHGYRVRCLGDDIAWLRVGEDGRLWAVNPENGFFGVAPGTNEKTNPNALHTTQRDTIFTNVAHDLADNTVWWEGLSDERPEHLVDWHGNAYDASKYDKHDASTFAAHPNSRFTSMAKNCPCLSDKFDDPKGVPISAIIFGGRRARLAPLVYQSFSWQHGVFVGSSMASETTAAASGKVGVVRRDPMAMRPFVGYDMGDYFTHWLDMGKKLTHAPKIFHVNWFRTDADGRFMWPGFGDNIRVLDWILSRCEGEADAKESAIGYLPYPDSINVKELDGVSSETVNALLEVNEAEWEKEADGIEEFYSLVGERVPGELHKELDALRARLK